MENVIFLFLTAIFGIIAYLYDNLFKINEIKMILAIMGLFILVVLLIGVSVKMSKEMKKLKEL